MEYDGEERRMNSENRMIDDVFGWKKMFNAITIAVSLVSLVVGTMIVGLHDLALKADRSEIVIMESKLIQRDHDIKADFNEEICRINAQINEIGTRQLTQISMLNELIGIHKGKMGKGGE